jgi:PiT family inorganic phosphate transporter
VEGRARRRPLQRMRTLVVVTVVTALVFDYTNGFHDTANAMATTIATRALRPRVAVAMASILNLVGAFLSVTVAATIASGIVEQTTITVPVVFAGLCGAIVWNVLTWYAGIPSSSSHALVGGVVGAVLAEEGAAGVIWSGLASRVLIPAVLAPFVCGIAAVIATRLAYRLTRSSAGDGAGRGFRASQVFSSGIVALAHGTNDAQKTMGVIVLTLVAGGEASAGSGVPLWVKATCALAVALGTFSGGWRVIRTLGVKVTHIQPAQGFSAETASASTILSSAFFGFSLSTTQVVSGGVVGAGLGRADALVDWRVIRHMVFTWGLTIPAAALMGAAAEGALDVVPSDESGMACVALLTATIVAVLAVLSHRSSVNAGNVIETIPAHGPAGDGDAAPPEVLVA